MTWKPNDPDATVQQAIEERLYPNLDLLRTDFVAGTEPASPVAYQLWADTSEGVLKRRNSANDGWEIEGALLANAAREDWALHPGTLNATGSSYAVVADGKVTIQDLVVVSESATTGSEAASVEWQFQLRNVTQGLDLFSGVVGTGTSIVGVGGGVEIAIGTPFVLTPDQNNVLASGDVLQVQWTKVGAPADLTDVLLGVRGYRRGV